MRRFKLVCVGGTFEVLHLGHRKLLEEAFKVSDYVLIGLTSDKFAFRLGKKYRVSPYRRREARLRRFLDTRYRGRYSIIELDDAYGVAVEMSELEAIVVSEETKVKAEEINHVRVSRGLKPLEIIVVPLILAEDGKPISSTRVVRGEVDLEGRILKGCQRAT